MTDTELMREFLLGMGCTKVRTVDPNAPPEEWYYLDRFDTSLYLAFDLTHNDERPDTHGTVDIFACRPGEPVCESAMRIQLRSNCTVTDLMQLLLGMGIDRFRQKTKGFLKEQLGI